MIEASKLAGMTFEAADGKLIRVLEASLHKPGKRKYDHAYEIA